MPPAPPVAVVPGTTPIVLVAPHGGRRDVARRPWGAGPLKVNDLHTAALTLELARATGAAAIVNAACDRNDVDLNRIGAAAARAPWFLERLEQVLRTTLARHGRAIVLTIHGWNVGQPAVDVGLGCARGPDPFAAPAGAAVSEAFAAGGVRALVGACAARDIHATVGARYPARGRENLLQLFTGRYRDDARPLVRALAGLGARAEAAQLELSVPLRWPGRWRDAFVAAYREALPALGGDAFPALEVPALGTVPLVPTRLQFAGRPFSGLAGVDTDGHGRLLLFRAGDEGLFLFTGERIDDRLGGLRIDAPDAGRIDLAYTGPLLRFPDTLPFLDLERGLARARVVDADVRLAFTPDRPGAEFGRIAGHATLDGARTALDAPAFAEEQEPHGPWPRFRTALRLDDGAALVLTVGLRDGSASGFLCSDGAYRPVVAARAELASADAPLARVTLDVDVDGGERLRVRTTALHQLPVVRSRGASAIRVFFAAACLDDGCAPAGWCEAAGL